MKTGPNKVKYNGLSSAQKYLLTKWIDDNKGLVSSLTDSDTALKATDTLKFNVSSGNVSGARRSLGMKRKNASVKRAKASSPSDAIVDLALAIYQLYIKLGEVVPVHVTKHIPSAGAQSELPLK